MSMDAFFVFCILGVSFFLFVVQWHPPEVVAVLGLVALVVSGTVGPWDAVAGFGSTAVVSIAALLIISTGLVRTGVVKWLSTQIQIVAGGRKQILFFVSVFLPGILSGFINIVAAVSVMIPAILRISRRNRLSPSRLLLPAAAGGLVGANLSLIGASHNLVINDLLKNAGQRGFAFFEFTPVGIILLLGMIVYALLLGRYLLPRHSAESQREAGEQSRKDVIRTYGLEERLWEVVVTAKSEVIGKTPAELEIETNHGLTLIEMIRQHHHPTILSDQIRLKKDDVLVLGGRKNRVEGLCAMHKGFFLMGSPSLEEKFSWSVCEVMEVMVRPRSDVIGKNLMEIGIRRDSELTGLALWRNGHPIRTDVNTTPLKEGDGLLLFGPRPRARTFEPDPGFVWLKPPRPQNAPLARRHLAPWAGLIFAGVILCAAFDWLPIAVAALAGAACMVATGMVKMDELYQVVEWKTIVLIGTMYPFGSAMKESGAAEQLGALILVGMGDLGPLAGLLGVGFLSLVLTQPLHNAVVAIIMTPTALQVAESLNANPVPFAVAVLVGASATFLLPVGHPAPLLVQEPGCYRLRDYLRFGAGLCVITLTVIGVVIPWLWPLSSFNGQ